MVLFRGLVANAALHVCHDEGAVGRFQQHLQA